jgi:hypothetical protein
MYRYDSLAVLASDVRLKPPSKRLVHDAAAVSRVEDGGRLTTGVMVEHVEGGDEELVSVLLLVAGQVAGVGPHEVKKLEGNVRSDLTGIELHECGVCMGVCTMSRVWMEWGIGNCGDQV